MLTILAPAKENLSGRHEATEHKILQLRFIDKFPYSGSRYELASATTCSYVDVIDAQEE